MASPEAKRLEKRDTYEGDKLNCDVVMKGGITSGIAYPLAVCEIATAYKLKNVGGSSAGAIAAAAAAAAEVGRASPQGGFHRLARLPSRLAGASGDEHSMLFELFQPQPGSETYYRILISLVSSKIPKARRGMRAVRVVVASFWPAALVGAFLGLVMIAGLLSLDIRWPQVRGDGLSVLAILVSLVGGIVLTFVGGVGAPIYWLSRRALTALPRLNYGICSGHATASTPAVHSLLNRCETDYDAVDENMGTTKPLTRWLADEIDLLAGDRPTDTSAPLTLGDLRRGGVTLKMFTTNITNGTPYTIPFNRQFFFTQEEMSAFFPPRVVTWMVENQAKPKKPIPFELMDEDDDHGQLILMPDWDKLPVIVATRMSLSFPILLAAVRLWQIDFGAQEAYRCWFSDGGITSNFPIHFFDSPIPRWPTFGLNLGPFLPGEEPDAAQCENIYFVNDNSTGIAPRWSHIKSVPAFVRSIADTMQNWSDNAQIHLPGYRDRIVLIEHTEEEGGMNLDMPHQRILNFSERGRCAGRKLVERFATQPPVNEPGPLSWDNHRWVRYRSSMKMLEVYLERWVRGLTAPPDPSKKPVSNVGQPESATLVNKPPSYGLTDAQRDRVQELTGELDGLIRDWLQFPPDGPIPDPAPEPADGSEAHDPAHPFHRRAPRPRPTLRATPDF